MRLKYPLFILLLLVIAEAAATGGRQQIRQGNRLFDDGKYAEAEEKYRQAIEDDGDSFLALYNLANTLYKQGRLEEAGEIFNSLTHQATSEKELTNVLHNLGNSYLGRGMIQESIDAYKKALRLSPGEENTRYNLAYAKNLLDEPPPQEDQDPMNDGRDESEREQDRPEAQNGDDEEDSHGEDTEHTPDQLTQEDAERILDALMQQEQEVQENIIRDEDADTAETSVRRDW